MNLFRRFLEGPYAFRWTCVFALVLLSPSLLNGFMADDFFFYAVFHGYEGINTPDDISLFNLFSFNDGDPQRLQQLIELGMMPWWTFEGFKYNFWRPLAELSHWLDYQLWPQQAILMHVHNLFWYLLVLIALRAVYARTFLVPWVLSLALILFALDSSHTLTVAWIANRNAMMAGFFALLSLLFFIRWREQQRHKYALAAAVLLLAALLSAEIALSITAYFFAYAMFLDRRGKVQGLLGLIPYALLCVIWWAFYKHAGFGASGSPAFYVDPAVDTLRFISELSYRLPVMLMSQWGIVPAEFSGFPEPVGSMVKLAAAVGLALVLLAWIPLLWGLGRAQKGGDAVLRFWFVATVISALPVCSALPQDRNLLFIGIGGCAVLARYIQLLSEQKADWSVLRRVYNHVLCAVLLVLHLLVSVCLVPVMAYGPKLYAEPAITAALQTTAELDFSSKKVAMINPPLTTVGYFNAIRFFAGKTQPDALWALTVSDQPLKVTRLDEQTLKLDLQERLLGRDGRLVRDPISTPLRLHQRVELQGLSMEVSGINEAGEVRQLLAHFDQNLEDPELVFYHWKGVELLPFVLPAIGDSVTIGQLLE